MARKPQSKGACQFCGREMTRGGLSRHLSSCAARQEANEASTGKKEQELFHLLVYNQWDKDYWLHLEVNGQATLNQIDSYLRSIWLECCGHLSMFTTGGWRGTELGKSRKVNKAFYNGVVLEHIYDFGTSSHTMLEMKGQRTGRPLTKHPIFLMARNNPPVIECADCGEPSTYMCYECLMYGRNPFICQKHFNKHSKHSEEGPPVEIANSPRMGMCGYDGPATPPY